MVQARLQGALLLSCDFLAQWQTAGNSHCLRSKIRCRANSCGPMAKVRKQPSPTTPCGQRMRPGQIPGQPEKLHDDQAKAREMFQKGSGDWTQYRSTFGLSKRDEVDLHFGRRDRVVSYEEAMAELINIIEGGLKEAQQNGRSYVMFVHGKSTSRKGKTTARSQVRSFMRSNAATSLIERKHCIQHETVFVAKVRDPQGVPGQPRFFTRTALTIKFHQKAPKPELRVRFPRRSDGRPATARRSPASDDGLPDLDRHKHTEGVFPLGATAIARCGLARTHLTRRKVTRENLYGRNFSKKIHQRSCRLLHAPAGRKPYGLGTCPSRFQRRRQCPTRFFRSSNAKR
jgi:hypothetical protein